jgi:hypothetical protein
MVPSLTSAARTCLVRSVIVVVVVAAVAAARAGPLEAATAVMTRRPTPRPQ